MFSPRCFRRGYSQTAGPLIWVHPTQALGLCTWVSRPLIWVQPTRGFSCEHPGGWSGCTLSWASGVSWGCLSSVHSPGTEGVGVQEATAAGENSLNSHCVPLFSLFLFEKFFLFKLPWSKPAPGLSHSPAWLSPKYPAADPAPRLGLQLPWSPRRSQGPYCP